MLVVYIVLLIFDYLSSGNIGFYFDLNIFLYFLIGLGAASLLFYSEKVEKFDKDKFDKVKKYISYSFLGLLLIVAVQSISLEIVPEKAKTPLIVATVVLGAVNFYMNRDKLVEIDGEIRKEEVDEKRRDMEFAGRYPRINRVWGVSWAAKWVYKEGFITILILCLVSIYSGILIFQNLDRPEFFHDEWWHVSTIKSLQEGEGFKLWNYITDEPIYEYGRGKIFISIVFEISKILGDDEYGLRFFPALIGILVVPLIYLMFKKFIGKDASLITSVMFSFSIIAIFIARFLRPYSLFLFSYLILFYFCYYFIIWSHEKKMMQIFISILGIILFFIIALDSSEFAKIIFSFIAIFFIGYLYYHKGKTTIKNYKLIAILLFVIFVINYFNLINLSILPRQLGETISLSKLEKPTTEYFRYLFENPFRFPIYAYAFFYLGITSLIINSLIKKRSEYSFFLTSSLIPLFIMVYLFNNDEDFRYIYFLIPFIYGCIALGFYWFIQNIFNTSLNINKSLAKIFLIIILLTTIIYPIVPGLNISGFTLKGPSDWQGSDGQQYLHRRAVATELKKAYDYVEQNISSPYSLVVSDYRVKYLERFKSKKVYFLDPLVKDRQVWIVASMKGRTMDIKNVNPNATGVSFEEILKENDKVVFIIENVHMLDNEIFKFLYTNTTNLAKEANISKYDYNSFYDEKDLYWPNIFVYDKNN